MKVPYSLPYISKEVIDEVNDVFNNTGWLTSGPKVIEFEKEIQKITSSNNVVCVNSWTSGAMLVLRWFGVGQGDEVIIPSYTYAATALAVLNIGAKPIMVDVKEDFTINPDLLISKISSKTKVIMPVDIGGWPCDYKTINNIVNSESIKKIFVANGKNQKLLNRILVLSDAAHSIGGFSNNKPVGILTDITVFSFHSVKNITTGEGGAICLNLPIKFNQENEYKFLKNLSLNGQNKSAFEKNQLGSWRYDIVDQGLKVNMPDICASVGLAQIKQYKDKLLPERKEIFKFYDNFFKDFSWAITPFSKNQNKESSYHLYMLRIKDINEQERDNVISHVSSLKVGVNVHYIPMPMLTFFKNLGFRMKDYPTTYNLYKNEITLPVYNNLAKKQLEYVCNSIVNAYNELKKTKK